MDPNAAIGLFDSGVGGLTVFSALAEQCPNERFVYLGDTARVPYGSKSAQTVIQYATNNAQALMAQTDLKMLVIACNTASAVALKHLQSTLDIPVVGVIEPGAQSAMQSSPQSIAVLATRGTLNAGAYDDALKQLGFTGELHHQPCPLFVPLAEEGWLDGDVPERVAQHYLKDLVTRCDALILGCTHYPLLLPLLQKLYPTTRFIDSAASTALHVAQELQRLKIQNPSNAPQPHQFKVTDHPEGFLAMATNFLKQPITLEDVTHLEVRPMPCTTAE